MLDERDELMAALKIVDAQNRKMQAEIERLRAENLELKTQMHLQVLDAEFAAQDAEAQVYGIPPELKF